MDPRRSMHPENHSPVSVLMQRASAAMNMVLLKLTPLQQNHFLASACLSVEFDAVHSSSKGNAIGL
jgi:hypothetical protein